MDLTRLKVARWYLRRWLGRMTWSWLAAGALLAFAAGFYFSMIKTAQRDLEAIEHKLLALQEETRVAEHSQARLTRMATPAQLAAFYKFFPSERSIPDWIEKISAAAANSKLNLRQVEYQVVRDKNSKLLRYQVMLSVTGTYPDLRGFIDDILSKVTIASLDNVKFDRQKIGEEALVSTVMLTLHLGSES